MEVEEIRAIAKKRGVCEDTVRTWIRKMGDEYARTHLPLSQSAKGVKSRKTSPWGSMFFLPGSPRRGDN